MILVVGGIASGKRTYAQSLGYTAEQLGDSLESSAPVLRNLEEVLRDRQLDAEELAALTRREVVTCCEVGMGVVPIDAQERAWRERVGRTCAQLAMCAERIVRMVCGIPVEIAADKEVAQ